MANYVNPASTISYTSKDFQTIFPELLELTKNLTPRWDPTDMGNESDPGVVLLKLNALLGDRLNYAIDKNVLEAFPLSLTQLTSARRLYAALGYNMPWYQSAVTDLTLSWIGDIVDDTNYVTIPAFTMVSDDENSTIYSLVGQLSATTDAEALNPTDIRLYYNSAKNEICSVRAIQGTAVNYEINGEYVIKSTHLDSNNRLYFSTTAVAQNGIFIQNAESGIYEWKRVDNLLVEKLGNKYFEFGVTDDLYSCYIQFPEDAEDLIRDGIIIKYIQSSGASGNLTYGNITKFATDVSATTSLSDASVILNSDSVKIIQSNSALGGADPEDINTAYKNFKKQVGTFKTLVTVRDYYNAMLNSGYVSNGFVCDRNTDVQCAYKIKAIVDGLSTDVTQYTKSDVTHTYTIHGEGAGYYQNGRMYIDPACTTEIVAKVGILYTDLNTDNVYCCSTINPNTFVQVSSTQTITETVDDIDSISIKLYALKNPLVSTKSVNDFYTSFNLMTNAETSTIKNVPDVKNYKHISMDYADILPAEVGNTRPCMFINKYEIDARIYTKLELDEKEKTALQNKVLSAFYNNLDASHVNFGESVQLDYINSVIVNCDARIKTAYIDTLAYNTYARYYLKESNSYVDILISDSDAIDVNSVTYSAPELQERTYHTGDLVMHDGVRFRCLRDNVSVFIKTAWVKDEYEFEIDYDTFVAKLKEYDTSSLPGGLLYDKQLIIQTGIIGTAASKPVFGWFLNKGTTELPVLEQITDLTVFGLKLTAGTVSCTYTENEGTFTIEDPDIITFQIAPATEVRDRIMAKSILAGKTPWLEEDEDSMDFNFAHPYRETYVDVATIEGVTNVSFVSPSYSYAVRPNEVIDFYAPVLTNVISYNNYVKVEGFLTNDLIADTNYQLKDNEFLIFYYLPSDESSTVYQYHAYGPGAIVNPTFNIASTIGQTICMNASYHFLESPGTVTSHPSSWKVIEIGSHQWLESSSDWNQDMSAAASTAVESYRDVMLSGSKAVSILSLNKVTVNSSNYCYWITETKSLLGNYILMYSGDKERVLGNNEYFIFTDNTLSTMEVYGAGTKLVRSATGSLEELSVSSDISYSELTDGNLARFSDKFYQLKSPLTCIQNDAVLLSDGCSILLKPTGSPDTPYKVVIDKEGARGYDEAGTKITDDPLQFFNIVYNLAGEVDYPNALTKQMFADTTGWQATALLQLTFDQKTGQIIYDNQKVIIYGNAWSHMEGETEVGTEIVGAEAVFKTMGALDLPELKSRQYTYQYYPCVLFANKTLSATSPGKTTVVTLNTDGEIEYTDISKATLLYSSSPLAVSPLTTGGTVLSIVAPKPSDPTNYTAVQTVTSLPAGSYIAKLTQSSTDISSLNVYFMSGQNVEIDCSAESFTPVTKTNNVITISNIPDIFSRFVCTVVLATTGTTKIYDSEAISDSEKILLSAYDPDLHKIVLTLNEDVVISSITSIVGYTKAEREPDCMSSSVITLSENDTKAELKCPGTPTRIRTYLDNNVLYDSDTTDTLSITWNSTSKKFNLGLQRNHFTSKSTLRYRLEYAKSEVTVSSTTIATIPFDKTVDTIYSLAVTVRTQKYYYYKDPSQTSQLTCTVANSVLTIGFASGQSGSFEANKTSCYIVLQDVKITVDALNPQIGTVDSIKDKATNTDGKTAVKLDTNGSLIYATPEMTAAFSAGTLTLTLARQKFKSTGQTIDLYFNNSTVPVRYGLPSDHTIDWSDDHNVGKIQSVLEAERVIAEVWDSDAGKAISYDSNKKDALDQKELTIDYDTTNRQVTATLSSGKTFNINNTVFKIYYRVLKDVVDPLGSDTEYKYFTTIHGEKNLVNCNNYPVLFNVHEMFDPATYRLPLYLTAKIVLKAGVTALTDTVTITITNPMRYIYNSSIPAAKIEKYKTLVNQLDPNKVFDYSYQPTSSELIKDPLKAENFLNINHIGNKYTICEFSGLSEDFNIV